MVGYGWAFLGFNVMVLVVKTEKHLKDGVVDSFLREFHLDRRADNVLGNSRFNGFNLVSSDDLMW